MTSPSDHKQWVELRAGLEQMLNSIYCNRAARGGPMTPRAFMHLYTLAWKIRTGPFSSSRYDDYADLARTFLREHIQNQEVHAIDLLHYWQQLKAKLRLIALIFRCYDAHYADIYKMGLYLYAAKVAKLDEIEEETRRQELEEKLRKLLRGKNKKAKLTKFLKKCGVRIEFKLSDYCVRAIQRTYHVPKLLEQYPNIPALMKQQIINPL